MSRGSWGVQSKHVVSWAVVALAVLATIAYRGAPPPGVEVQRSEVFRDGDFVVYEAKAGGTSAPAVRNNGYATYGNVVMRESYVIRLIDTDGIERVRPIADEVAATMRDDIGQRVTVADELFPRSTTDTAGHIDIRVSSSSPCTNPWLGCAAPTVDDGVVQSAQIWISPRLFDKPANAFANTVRHELGHAFGLAHYDGLWDGRIQTMHSTDFDATDYRSGDRNGLLALAIHATPPADDDDGHDHDHGHDHGQDHHEPSAAVPAPPRVDPTGTVDEIVSTGLGVLVRGEATDPDTPDAIGVLITMDDQPFELLAARNDPATGTTHGYEVLWSVDPGPHRICVTARNVGPGTDVPLGCRDIVVTRTSVGQLGLQTL